MTPSPAQRLVGRAAKASAGYAASVLTVVAVAFLLLFLGHPGESLPVRPTIEILAVVAAVLVACTALPVLAIIVVAERSGINHWFYFAYSGAVTTAITLHLLRFVLGPGEPRFNPLLTLFLLAVGFVAGFVYWLVAGRRSGLAAPRRASAA